MDEDLEATPTWFWNRETAHCCREVEAIEYPVVSGQGWNV